MIHHRGAAHSMVSDRAARWSAGRCRCGAWASTLAVGVFAFLFTDIEGSTALLQRVGGTALSFDQAISLALEGASSAT